MKTTKIKYTTSEWMPVLSIPSGSSKSALAFEAQNGGSAGVYQVAHKTDIDSIGDNIEHKSIGYTGMSKSVFHRSSSIKHPKGSHQCGKYIRNKELCKETEVYIRYLFVGDDESLARDLEKYIHDTSMDNYGYRFKWEGASAGLGGHYIKIVDGIDKLTSMQMLDLITFLKDEAPLKAAEEIKIKMDQILLN